MTARLSPQRETETPAEIRLAQYGERTQTYNDGTEKALHQIALELQAELNRTRTELAKYVGQEPTVVEEMAYLNRCLNAVYDVCDEAKRQARRWEDPLPVPEWVATVEQAADGQRTDNDLKDRRRRIYIDGNGEAWISLSHDKDIRYIGRLAGAIPADDTVDSVREATGSLREIGRCW